jgi:ribonuclease P protein component
MKRRFRLKSSGDFSRVRQLGKSYVTPLLVMIVLPNQMEHTRIGVAAGRTVGKAVQRNRAKRLIRAALQPNLTMISTGYDLLFIARQRMRTANLEETQDSIITLLSRTKLLK